MKKMQMKYGIIAVYTELKRWRWNKVIVSEK